MSVDKERAKFTREMLDHLDELTEIVKHHAVHPSEYVLSLLRDRLTDLVKLYNQIGMPDHPITIKHGFLFDIGVTDKRGRVVRTFLMFGQSSNEVAAAFSALNQAELADGDAPLIPEGGSYSVGAVEFEHPSGISEI